MEPTENTIRQQFAQDYTLVVDNDQKAHKKALDIARKAKGSVPTASDKYREEFETYISEVVERERGRGNTTGADLISQMLIGYGSAPFDDIARHYIDTELETRLYDRFTSRLKTEATK